ncbi:MAG TPA: tRNA 2-thiouridine(34) synthase MnmA [Syntrophomonadaceae bacterium]|jgi:tRNA-specific 2-thiouridylase|nr:tRNA 2-thiouridine(34) synthase MnmA [Syntrophomonadaceae bacterium]HOQ09509.1 tRNA 2-thiouridine(34) synthase MnmA [Syntrophomonadaceae bacterium]HPU48418.1 tRNA 2-thiouridine(34) synthase MnmA [Syntrophomonadaceae bacterium]
MKVAVLMSGGVDSSVSCLLLKEQGYEVEGLTMINWDPAVGEKAARVAAGIGVKHSIVDLRKEFKEQVVDYFCSSYQSTCTPNPCVECNRWIKFGALLEIARNRGYDMVATGHYARIHYHEASGRYHLLKGTDPSRDQSYFLYRLTQEQLAHILFPLGEMTKKQVRQLAARYGLAVAEEPDSQEICFINGDYREFLREQGVALQPGEIVNMQGEVLGRHRGLTHYTIGQRKGLGISAGKPVFVVGMDPAANRLIVDDEYHLFRKELVSVDNNWIGIADLEQPLAVEAKIRSAARPAQAVIEKINNDQVRVNFQEPQRAITPGQSVVFYQGDLVIGGGRII